MFAYFDSFAGLVPCRVLSVATDGVVVRLTAARGPYRRGEVLTWPHTRIVSRKAVYRSGYTYRIRPHDILSEVTSELGLTQ